MPVKELKKGVYTVGVNHRDRKLFDELIPLPDGTSYNAYFIKGSQKNVLLDTVDPSQDELFKNLEEMKVDRIDYIISHHAEQDHSGRIPDILKRYPEARVLTNPKCKDFLMDLLLLSPDQFQVINDGQTLSLGDRTLKFILAPWAHWPETMLTYLEEDKILFSCDLFGSHLATAETFVKDESKVFEAAKRYYAEIMMPFRANIVKHLEKIQNLKIDLICPSHGPIYDKPSFILKAYKDWISDQVKNEVILPYVSMHGSTQKMADHLTRSLNQKGIHVKPYNLTETDLGQLAISLVDAASVIIATPTVLIGPHPAAVYATYLINALRPKIKFFSMIGSFGWGSKAEETIRSMITNLKADYLDPVMIKGHPKEADLKALNDLAERIYQKHKELNLL
ncbi:MAG: FprA family A-type flavoprotein [Spirochaetes bacterium]|nr:FprA family A-type flavoprotein [Spirochaetota bacterium]